MFWIFKKQDKTKHDAQIVTEGLQPKEEPKVYVKGAKIAYYPNLVEEFKEEHAQLFSLYTEIVKNYEENQVDRVSSNLKEFKQVLVDHLMRENILLYIFLKYLYVENIEHKNYAYKMQKEMTTIGNSVFDFIKRATSDSFEYNSEFKSELDAIGAALIERVELEESSLYSLYVHPEKVS